MDLSSKKVIKILKAKGVDELHHANSVITACQFLREGALLSRGSIERRGFFQTPQKSDDIDVRYGLWFDVFTDSVDIHARARRMNVYGPVLFVLDLDIIKEGYTGRIWVTKTNPVYWANKDRDERWFQSSEELEQSFKYGSFGQMIVFRHCGGELPFKKSLRKIVLDDPKMQMVKEDLDFWSCAYGALKLAMTEGGIDVPIEKRKCATSCDCLKDYGNSISRTRQMFFPKV